MPNTVCVNFTSSDSPAPSSSHAASAAPTSSTSTALNPMLPRCIAGCSHPLPGSGLGFGWTRAVRVAIHRLLQDRCESRRKIRRDVVHGRRRLVQPATQSFDPALRRERPPSCHRLEDDRRHGVHVGATIDLSAHEALGRHVVRRNRAAGAGSGVERRHGAQTEPGQHGATVVGEQDVRGLHVAVDGGTGVRVVEGVRDRPQQSDHAECVITYAGPKHLIERLARDHLGHQVRTVARIGELIETRDGRMLEGDVGAQLKQEPPRKADVAGDRRFDGAQGNPAVHAWMLGLVDHTEAIGLELAYDAVTADLETVLVRVRFGAGAVPAPALGCHRNLNFSHKTRQALLCSLARAARGQAGGGPHLVSARGFEPPRPFGHRILSPARLPFRHADIHGKR